MAKSASLTAGLVAKKGEATPVSSVSPAVAAPASSPSQRAEAAEIKSKEPPEPAKDYFKALTVKLDKARYLKLKQLGLERDKSSQDLFVEALDAFLKAES